MAQTNVEDQSRKTGRGKKCINVDCSHINSCINALVHLQVAIRIPNRNIIAPIHLSGNYPLISSSSKTLSPEFSSKGLFRSLQVFWSCCWIRRKSTRSISAARCSLSTSFRTTWWSCLHRSEIAVDEKSYCNLINNLRLDSSLREGGLWVIHQWQTTRRLLMRMKQAFA